MFRYALWVSFGATGKYCRNRIEEGDTEPLAMAFGYVNFNYQNNNLELKEKNTFFFL